MRSVTLNLAIGRQFGKEFLRTLASGRGSFVKMALVVPGGFEVAVDSKLSSRRVMHDRKHIN